MTFTQRDALQGIRVIIKQEAERIQREYPNGGMDGKPVTPSSWVFIHTLTRIHHFRLATIRALVRQGWLEERPSGGFGPEVRPTLVRG